MKAYQFLFSAMGARARCVASGNEEWRDRHETRAADLVAELFPSGGGFDNGTTLSAEDSSGDLLVFETAFHHMHESGVYDGWTSHIVRIGPAGELAYTIGVTGPNRNEIKDYIRECFALALDIRVTRYGAPVPEATAEYLGISPTV